MGKLGVWVRSEWRHGWRALVGLALLVSIGGGVTLAAWAGARRADSAFERFVDEVSGALAVSAGGAPTDVSVFDDTWELAPQIAAIPGVRGVTPTAWMAVAFEIDNEPQAFFAVAVGPGSGSHPPQGGKIIEGRAAINADEVVVNEAAAAATGKGVGDVIVLRSYATDQIDTFIGGESTPDRGPRVEARIAGISRSAEDISDNPEPIVMLSKQFYDSYADRIAHCDCSLWIAAAPGDVVAVSARLPSVTAGRPLVVERLNEQLLPRVDRAVSFEVGALNIAALITAVSTVLVVVQALGRHVEGRSSAPSLMAIGATRAQIVRAWAIVLTPPLLVGTVGAVVWAAALSPLFPRGLARRAEVAPGLRLDALVLTGGTLALVVVVSTSTLIVSWRATRVGPRPARRSSASGRAPWLSSPAASMGIYFAVDPSRHRSRVIAITAVTSLALAIGAPISVALLERSIEDVLTTPSAFAADWDMQLLEPPDDPEALIAAVTGERLVEGFAVQYQSSGNQWTVTGRSGTELVAPVAFDPIIGSMGPILTRGRLPETADEVVIGVAIARRLGSVVGEEVSVDSGRNGEQTFRVSGIGRLNDGDDIDTAFVTTPEGLARLQDASQQSANGAFIRFATTSSDDVAVARLRLEAIGFSATLPPSRVATLDQIGSVPRLLAVALIALGLGGVMHSLLVAGSRRRSDIAIAKALGFTRREAAATLRWQAAFTCAFAAALGIPLGLLLGRVIWKRVASGVGAADLVSIPWPALFVTPLLAFPLVISVGSLVGLRAARVNTAAVLRSE